MDKPFVIANKEMKERIAEAVNISMNEIPADVIADFLEKLTINIRMIAEKQLEAAEKQFSESEDKTE